MNARPSHRRGRGRPPWWADGEPWPPRDAYHYAQQRRARFLRRSGWYSFWPIWILLFLAANSLRGHGGSLPAIPNGSVFVLILACAAAACTVAFIIRRIAAPVANIVSAADRIARRDYRVRIDEPASAPRWVSDTTRAFNAMAKELEAQDQARRQLTADIAHELRTPLAILQGTIEGIVDGVYAPDPERLQGLLDDTRVLTRLVTDLGTLSTAESGALALSREPTDLVSLADDVVSSLQARAAAGGITLVCEAAAHGEIGSISVDPVRITEVLTNLVTNAIRHTPRGGRVSMSAAARPAAIELRVTDTGTGIAPDALPHIFDRFYKGSGSAGSGLGLTIARNLVEAHGGTLRAESRVGTGTTMIVTLPA